MLRRTYRVFVDMDVSVRPIAPSRVPDEREVAPQRALQRELLNDRAMFDRRMEFEAFTELQHGGAFETEAIDLGYQSFLLPLVDRLSPPARKRFRRAFSVDELDLLLDEFFCCFEIRVVHTDIDRIHGPLGSPGTADEVLQRRRYRITVDADAEIHDASVERTLARGAERALRRKEMGIAEPPCQRRPPLSGDEMRFVQELLDEVVRDPDELDAYLTHDVLTGLRDGHLEGHGPEDYGDIHELVDRLSLEHQRWFRAAAAREMFYERSEQVEASFQAEPLGIAIFALRD